MGQSGGCFSPWGNSLQTASLDRFVKVWSHSSEDHGTPVRAFQDSVPACSALFVLASSACTSALSRCSAGVKTALGSRDSSASGRLESSGFCRREGGCAVSVRSLPRGGGADSAAGGMYAHQQQYPNEKVPWKWR